jgi:hypothetical protein
MNNKLLLLTIIIVVVIIIFITLIIINNTNQKIEKFVNGSYMNFPRIVLPNSKDTFEISIIKNNQDMPERQYPSKAFDSSTGETIVTGELQNILPTKFYKQTINLNNNDITYGSGDYIIYSSTTWGILLKNLFFNFNFNDSGAHFATSGYNANGVYNQTNGIIPSDYTGDWIIIKFPVSIILTKFIFKDRPSLTSRAPGEWKCYGSNDGIIFTEIKEASQSTRLTASDYSGGTYTKILNTSFNTNYIYIGFTFNKNVGGDIHSYMINFNEIQFFGKESFINLYDINLIEKYSILADISTDNLGINGYGTYYLNSTYYIDNPSSTNCISALFNNSNSIITLKSPYQLNMIIISYPERFQFKGLELTLNGNAKLLLENKVELVGYFKKIPSKIKTSASYDNNKLTFNLVNETTNVIFDSTLYIIIKTNKLEITNLKIFGMPLNYTEPILDTPLSALSDEDIGIFSNNDMEKLPTPFTGSDAFLEGTDDTVYPETGINNKFNLLLKNNLPWGMYSASTATGATLNDIFKRECKKATISGSYNIKSESTSTSNIIFLEGSQNTEITFPYESLPERYTVCVMTKYTSTDIQTRGRILTCEYPRNWLLGHWGNRENGIMYNNGWKYYNNIHKYNDTSTNWLISCAKSSAKNTSYSLIFNDTNRAFSNAGNNYNVSTTRLTINRWPHEKSNFGFAYLIIWDKVLSDSELLIVSQVLTNYSKTGEELNISNIIIPIEDGKSRETAGISAIAIKNATCTNVNGVYWIKNPDTGIAKQVYCIMDSTCYGGGWMLAMKGSNNSSIFSYSGAEDIQNGTNTNPNLKQKYNIINHWETNSVVREDDLDYNSGKDAKYDIFNYFKVSQCLAIFDKKDTGIENLNNYGWTWYEQNFYNKKLSLKDFFATSRAQFTYYSLSNYDFVAGYNNGKPIDKHYDRAYITRINAASRESFNQTIMKNTYTPKIWSRQDGFRAFGFNITPVMHIWHKVRWGGLFNNESDIFTSDVSGGIGLFNHYDNNKSMNAGNYPTCCETAPVAVKKQMGFKWFIR